MPSPSAVILSAYSRTWARLVGGLVRIEAGLLEEGLVVEQRRDVGVERDAVEAALVGGHGEVARARGRELGIDPIASVTSTS